MIFTQLPMPLSKQETEKLLSEAKESYPARSKLIEHNFRLVVYYARKFDTKQFELEDLVSVGVVGLIKAINAYRGDIKDFDKTISEGIVNEIKQFINDRGNFK